MRTHFFAVALASAAILGSGTAHAWPQATMSFSNPTGTISATDSVDVWVDLTIDANGPNLYFNPNANAPFGLDPFDLPANSSFSDSNGIGQAATITNVNSASLDMWFGCSGSFTTSCLTGNAYNFTFADGFRKLYAADGSLTISTGTTAHFLFGTFTPSNGPVAPGTYTFYRATLGLSVSGTGIDSNGNPVLNPDGTPMSLSAYSFPYKTCDDNLASCAFTRTVTAVPEPETYGMLLAGLSLLGLIARRRTTSV